MKMGSRASSIILVCFFLVASASALDIVKLLDKYPMFSTFATALEDSKLAASINSQTSSITVLAVADKAASALTGMSPDDAKKQLATHVLLDYFDEDKLKGMAKKDKKPSTIVTIYQTLGSAQNQQGFVLVGTSKTGDIAFGSAVKEGSLDSKFIMPITSIPFNVSVLQVSSLIEVSGLTPVLAPNASPPEDESDEATAPSSDEDATLSDEEAVSPVSDEDASLASPPVEGDSPAEAPAEAPEASPTEEKSEEKAADGGDEEAAAVDASAASKMEMTLGAGFVMGLASFFA